MTQYQDITVLLVHLGIAQRDIAKKLVLDLQQ